MVSIVFAIAFVYRALLVHNYLNLKKGKEIVKLKDFINGLSIEKDWVKFFIIIPFLQKNDIKLIDQYRKRVNVVSVINYVLIALTVLGLFYENSSSSFKYLW
jgi:hypothetical protein